MNLNKKCTVIPENFISKGRATPFEGWELYGDNVLTLLRGEIVYEAI